MSAKVPLWFYLYRKTSNWGLKDGEYEICCDCGEILPLELLPDHGKIIKCGKPLNDDEIEMSQMYYKELSQLHYETLKIE